VNRALREVRDPDVESDGDAWEGIKDDEPVIEPVDHEAEYVDEDRYTTVTVEAVDISKDGFSKVRGDSEDEDEKEVPLLVEKEEKIKKVWPKKAPKKKFRYESKAERKVTRGKQKAGNKAKADARRGD
ncbi:hypothetical protein LSUE1_G004766, partial [Lachnellula suecica]